MHKILQPDNWVAPIGYSNGISARGRTIFIGGQIGWNEQCEFETDDFVEQVHQTLKNIVAILAVDGAGPEHITSMTWYFTDKQEYLASLKGIGDAYRSVLGRHFPAMTMVQVADLIEDEALIEIEATAYIRRA